VAVYETTVTVPVGRFGNTCLHVRYYPSRPTGFYDEPEPPELEIVAATSENGMRLDLAAELDEDAFEQVYDAAITIADVRWCEDYDNHMRPEQGEEWT